MDKVKRYKKLLKVKEDEWLKELHKPRGKFNKLILTEKGWEVWKIWRKYLFVSGRITLNQEGVSQRREMIRIPDTKNVIEIIYRYKSKSMGTREYYLEGKEVKEYLSNIGGASIMGIIHGISFSPLNWKVRRLKRQCV